MKDTGSVAKALSEFQKEAPHINMDSEVTVKTRTGSTYKFKYATLANILKLTLPVLSKHGLAFSQVFRKRSLMTILMHSSGESLVSILPINLSDGNMQEIGSRISYLKRYSLTAMLGIVGDEDDDGNVADGNDYSKAVTKQPRKVAKKEVKETVDTENAMMTDAQRRMLFAKMTENKLSKVEAKDFFDYTFEGQERTKKMASTFIDNFDHYLVAWNEWSTHK